MSLLQKNPMRYLLKIYLFFLVTLCHSEGLVEFCAEYSKDSNEYSLHVVKNLNMEPDSSWVFPDSIVCTVYNGEPIWEIEYSLNAPHDSSEAEFIGGCVTFDVTPSTDTLCLKPKIAIINLNPVNRDVLHIHKNNAKETLPFYYRKRFKGRWNAKLAGTSCVYEKRFEAVIIGSCNMKKKIIAEYCIDQFHRLVLEQEHDYIPRYIFALATECNVCNKEYSENISASIAFKKGKFTPVEGMMYKSCEDYSLKDAFLLPHSIKKEKSLYGKVLPVRIDAEIQSDSIHRKDYYDVNIRVSGPCKD